MTDYYLKDVHSVLTRVAAEEMVASLPLAIYRKMGFQHQALELALECDWIEEGTVWPAPYSLTPLEHEALEAKRLFGKVVVGVDPASPDGDRDAVVVGKYEGDQFVPTDAATLDLGQYVAGITEEGKLKLSNANLGLVTPGHKKLNEVEASKIARVKNTGNDFIEVIESMRRQTRVPDCQDPSIVHFREDPHDHQLRNALDRAEEAIMWAVKYITAG